MKMLVEYINGIILEKQNFGLRVEELAALNCSTSPHAIRPLTVQKRASKG